MIKPLSQKDLVKWGLHELSRGRSLQQIEAEFHKKEIQRKNALKALKTIDYLKKRDEHKAQKAEALKKQAEQKAAVDAKQTGQAAQAQEKFSFGAWLVLAVIIGIALYALYLIFSGK
jgi:multidrug efflux pump subunit AcrB